MANNLLRSLTRFISSTLISPSGEYKPAIITGRTSILSLSVGISFGFTFAYILYYVTEDQIQGISLVPKWHDYGHSHFDDLSVDDIETILENNDELDHVDEDLVARALKEKVKVICWVDTTTGNHKNKAVHVKATWAQRFDTLLFMSSTEDKNISSIAIPVTQNWGKTKEAFKYVYKNHADKYDWVMKAEDDTYVIAENLRYLLKDYDPEKPLYVGCRLKQFVKQGYMQGGAGYVLSKEALRRFVVDGLEGRKCREQNDGAEDVEMGKCMELLGVEAVDTRDSLGRQRFFPFDPYRHIFPKTDDTWFATNSYYPLKNGSNSCSDLAVSFHEISAGQMYVLEYFLYHLRPFGIDHATDEPDAS